MSKMSNSAAERGRLGAHVSWANTADKPARTSAARRAFMARFEREVDPDGVLNPAERGSCGACAQGAYDAHAAGAGREGPPGKQAPTHIAARSQLVAQRPPLAGLPCALIGG